MPPPRCFLTAQADFGGNTYYTRTGTNNAVNLAGGNGLEVANTNIVGPAVSGTVVVPSNGVTLAADNNYFLFVNNITPAVLGPGTTMRARIDFDATGVITYDHNTAGGPGCYIGAAPTITVAFY